MAGQCNCAPIGSPNAGPPGSPVKIPQIESSPKVPQISQRFPQSFPNLQKFPKGPPKFL